MNNLVDAPTCQLDWLLNTPVASYDHVMIASRIGAGFATTPLMLSKYGDTPAHVRNRQVKPVVCADGFSVSVQASDGHYCRPRNDQGPWTHVELGYPSDEMGDQFNEYQDGQYGQSHTDCVFGSVPVELVRDLIAAHGGEKL